MLEWAQNVQYTVALGDVFNKIINGLIDYRLQLRLYKVPHACKLGLHMQYVDRLS